MKLKITAIASLVLMILLPGGLLLPAEPAYAGGAVWSAETIPDTLEFILGPDGAGDNLDVRDFSFYSDGTIVYAAPGDSVSNNVIYKSIDSGLGWDELEVDITTDLVAVAPDNSDMVVIANSGTPELYLTIDGGVTWHSLGTPPNNGGPSATAIYDIEISPVRNTIHYIAAAGTDANGDANVWIFNQGAGVPTWKATKSMSGFDSGDLVAAMEFSPNFSSDLTMVVVSADISVSPKVELQILDVVGEAWNSNADYTNFPRTVVNNSGITGISSASLSLAPNYLGTDDDTRKLFIGLTIDGNDSAVAASGIYRYVDTVKTNLKTDVKIHSVAYNGSYLVAGSYDTTTVYRSANPWATSPTFYTTYTTKKPGGEEKVLVYWVNNKVMAGTSGDESSLSISTDKGQTFNDISLIDTYIENATDVAVSSDGNKVYFATDDGEDFSLWRKTNKWQRVYSLQDTTEYIVRIARQDPDYVFLAKKNTNTIYTNYEGGLTQWKTRTCNLNIQDLVVESTTVLYALNNVGVVSRSNNSGFGWLGGITTGLNSGATIFSVTRDTILVGSQDGYVAYSTDGNRTWYIINEITEIGAGNVQVVADRSFATNKTIYAASDTEGQNIKQWQIGTSTVWKDIFKGNITGGIYGLVVNDGTLYALEFDSSSGQSKLWLCISPTSATETSSSWSSSATTSKTDIDDGNVYLNATPHALRASTDKLWAVKTNGTNKLYSYSDLYIEFSLTSPAQSYISPVNKINGLAQDICFTWDRPTEPEEYELEMGYELEIALDKEFNSLVTIITVTTINSVVSAIAGPGQTGNNYVNFMPGTTYYWRIRTSQPVYSRYSTPQHLYVESLDAILPAILSPPSGCSNTSRKPAFSWNPVSGATEYQFILSANASMVSPIVDTRVNTTAYAMSSELDYGGTYFWKVRATRPIETDWSQLGIFTVMEQPAGPVPPLTVETPSPPVIEIPAPPPQNIITVLPPLQPPEPIVPDYLRVAIIMASVILVIVVALAAVRLPARLLPETSTLTGPFRGPSRKARYYGDKLGKKWGDLTNRLRELAPSVIPPPAADKTVNGDTISFAVRSFLLITSSAEEGQRPLSVKEERTLGKKLASGIRALAKEKPLYLAYPEDAVNFLQIWSRYGSRDETNEYLEKSFKSKPENALALLKCYQEASESPEAVPAGKKEFTREAYDELMKVVDPDSVYTAISKILKFRFEKEEDKTLEDPNDRAIAYQFVRIHYDIKK
jgi:hypothetical protein